MSTQISTAGPFKDTVTLEDDDDQVQITISRPGPPESGLPEFVVRTAVDRAALLGAIYDELDVLLATHEDEERNLTPEQDRRVSALHQAREVLRGTSADDVEGTLLKVARWIIDGTPAVNEVRFTPLQVDVLSGLIGDWMRNRDGLTFPGELAQHLIDTGRVFVKEA